MHYYLDGSPVTEARAKAEIAEVADRRGYESENWLPAWNRRQRSEEARDFLSEISDYTVELRA